MKTNARFWPLVLLPWFAGCPTRTVYYDAGTDVGRPEAGGRYDGGGSAGAAATGAAGTGPADAAMGGSGASASGGGRLGWIGDRVRRRARVRRLRRPRL